MPCRSLLRIDNEENPFFFPYGKFSKGYALDTQEKVSRASDILQTQYILLILLSITGFHLDGWKGSFFFLPFSIPIYFLQAFQICKKLKKNDINWSDTTPKEVPKKAVTFNGLLKATFVTCILIFVDVWILLTESKSYSFVEIGIIFVLILILFTLVQKILKKEYVRTDKKVCVEKSHMRKRLILKSYRFYLRCVVFDRMSIAEYLLIIAITAAVTAKYKKEVMDLLGREPAGQIIYYDFVEPVIPKHFPQNNDYFLKKTAE